MRKQVIYGEKSEMNNDDTKILQLIQKELMKEYDSIESDPDRYDGDYQAELDKLDATCDKLQGWIEGRWSG